MRRILSILLGAALAIPAAAQTDSIIHVKTFPGITVGAKVAAAMLTCQAAPVPCILTIDASLAAAPSGTMPTLCSNCYLYDFRSGPPSQTTIFFLNGAAYPSPNAAIAYACSLSAPATVFFPPGTYTISSPIPLTPACLGIRIEGSAQGNTIFQMAGAGDLFDNTGASRVEIAHLRMIGVGGANSVAIHHISGQPINCYYHDNNITDFGSVLSGGVAQTQAQLWNGTSFTVPAGATLSGGEIVFEAGADSLGTKIEHNSLGGVGNIVVLSGPVDTLNLADNIIGMSPLFPNGPTRGIYVNTTGDAGAVTEKISHNNFTNIGLESLYLSSDAAWIVEGNESEDVGPVLFCASGLTFPACDANSSAWDIEAAVRADMSHNFSSTHGFTQWQFYVGNTLEFSSFSGNWGTPSGTGSSAWSAANPGAVQNVFHVGSESNNVYSNNTSTSGASTIYGQTGLSSEVLDNVGIVGLANSTGLPTANHGCGVAPAQGNVFCFPGVVDGVFPSSGNIGLFDSNDHNRALFIQASGPSTDAPHGYYAIYPQYIGADNIPLVLNTARDANSPFIYGGLPDANTLAGDNEIHGLTLFPDGVSSSAGYQAGGVAGYTGTKTAGSCVLTISGGIITNVTGC